MDKAVDRIIDWLKANGTSTHDDKILSFTCKDEPYLDFAAEWQDWGTHEVLMIEYYSIENGDVCSQPLYTIRIKEGEITRITCDMWLIGLHLIDDEEDKQYVMDCLSMFYDRHMATRPAEVL